MGSPSRTTCPVVLQLIDSSTGTPQQTWRFPDASRIVIGRAEDSDVVIANPYVSRSHAYLEHADGAWRAVTISSQQLFVEGAKVECVDLVDGLIFRLGPNGSDLRFHGQEDDYDDSARTLSVEATSIPMLVLDRERLTMEVNAIANDAFFQSLARVRDQLRERQ